MASNTLTDYSRNSLVAKVVELYFSTSLDQLFEEEIRKTWNEYIKSLAPDANENMLFRSTAYNHSGEKGKNSDSGTVSVSDCFEAFLPCTEINNQSSFSVFLQKCPDPRFDMAVSMYLDHKKKRDEFAILLKSRLININTEAQLKERLPEIAQYLDSETTSQNLAVAIDLEAIEVSIDDQEEAV